MSIDLLEGNPKDKLGFDPNELRAKYRYERDKRLREDGKRPSTRKSLTNSPAIPTIRIPSGSSATRFTTKYRWPSSAAASAGC